MSLDLYFFPTCPAGRAVALLAKTLEVKLNLKLIDLKKGEQHSPEFLKLVPIMNTGKHGETIYLDKLKDAFNVLDKILAGQTWTAGNSITIADYAIVISVASAEVAGFDISKYQNVGKWYERAKNTIPGYKEINDKGNTMLKDFLQ